MFRRTATIIGAALLACGVQGAASARQDAPSDAYSNPRNWPRVAFARYKDCQADARGPGNIFLVSAYGLTPGEQFQFKLVNGNKNLIYDFTADQQGQWSTAFSPVQINRTTGIAYVNIIGEGCFLSLAIPWDSSKGFSTDE